MNSLVVLLAVQILFSIFLIVWVRLKVMRSLDDGDSIARVRREIGALIVELDGSADRNITVMEDRLRELKECIAEADKRIVMLSNEKARSWAVPPVQLQRAHGQQTDVLDQLPAVIGQRPATQEQLPTTQEQLFAVPGQLTATQEQQFATRRQVQAKVQPAATTPPDRIETVAAEEPSLTGSARAPSIPFIRFSDKPLVFEEPFADRVARLHKRGFSSDIIAAKLKATIAEVDLAIAAGWNPSEDRGEG